MKPEDFEVLFSGPKNPYQVLKRSQKMVKKLYWSTMKMYEDCPRKFSWYKGIPGVDLGGGVGRRKPVPVKSSMHHAIMGIVLADFWEWLYNNEEWRHPQGIVDRMIEKAKFRFLDLMGQKHIDWSEAPPQEEMWETIKSGIVGYFDTMKHHKLLGEYARSEVNLTGYIDQYSPIGGRADLIIRRDDTGVTILDGKNSRRYKRKTKEGGWMTFTDPDQLRWYALCYYLTHDQMPDRLGFVYYRYPYGKPYLDTSGNQVSLLNEEGLETGEVQLEEGIVWVDFTFEDLEGIAQRAKDVLYGIYKKEFDANPVPSTCRMCDYETVCDKRIAQKRKNRRGPRKRKEVKLPKLSPDGTFGFPS